MSASTRRLGLGAALASLLAGGVACQVVLGLEEPKQGVLPGVVDPCRHEEPPSRPDAARGGPEASYWLVMTKIDFPATFPDGGPRGFDLDEACTCTADLHDGGAPCRGPSAAPSCDAVNGIDNTFAETLTAYRPLFDLNALSAKFGNTGGRGILLHLAGYNGQPDDDDVSLSVVATEGLYSNLGCDELPRPDAALSNPNDPYYVPKHDGCDHWKVKEALLSGSGSAAVPFSADVNKGWVRGGQLVVRAASMVVPVAGRLLRASDTMLVGRLEEMTVAGQRRFQISGGLAGARAPISAFTDLIGYTVVNGPNGGGNQPLCTVGTLWPQVKRTLCESLDTTSPKSDFTGGACNAFSVVWGFTGYPIRVDEAPRTFTPESTSSDCEQLSTPEQLCQ